MRNMTNIGAMLGNEDIHQAISLRVGVRAKKGHCMHLKVDQAFCNTPLKQLECAKEVYL